MAQTIQIKRSTGTAAPTSLSNGELAYLVNTNSGGIGPAQKLYIGRPGGGPGDIDEIGGKDTVDKANNALPKAGGEMTGNITMSGSETVDGRDLSVDGSKLDGIDDNANNYVLPVATNSALGGIKIGYSENGKNYPVELDSQKAYVNVPWTDTNETLAQTLVLGSTTGGTDISVTAGDDINFLGTSTSSKAIFGGDSTTDNRLEIFYDSTTARIKEIGTGGLVIEGEDLTFQDANAAIAMKMTTVATDRVFEFRDASDVQIAQFKEGEIKIASTSQLKTDDISETTTDHGVHIDSVILKDGEVEGNIKTDLISEKTADNGVVIDSVVLKDGGVFATGEVEGTSLDINGTADISGGLAVGGNSSINGNLFFGNNKKIQMGTTTSSTNLEIYTDASNAIIEENRSGNLVLRGTNLSIQSADDTNLIQAITGGAVTLYHQTDNGSGGYNATPRVATSSSGATVSGTLTVTGDLNITGDVNSTSVTDLDVTDKTITVGKGQLEGASANSGLVVDGASAQFLYNGTQFEIDDGDGVLHGVIHEGNSATQTYTIDGGTF
jgi:hypothetical protein